MADLAALTVKLTAEISEYSASVQKATDQIVHFSETVGDSIRDVAKDLLGLEALKQVFDFTDNIIKSMASFDELSHSVGATTETLSQLSFAGKLTGVDDIGAALEKMARSVGAAETGNQKLISTFSALGVTLTDSSGKVKSADQQLLDIADAVSKYNDGLAKTSAVQAIFGRGGADFIKFLDQGADAIKAAQQEAIDLGVSISSPAAKAADEFESNMTRIGAAFEGVFFKTLQEVLPVFQSITDQIIAFAKNANNTQPIVEQLAAGFKIIASVVVIVGTAFEVVGKTIGALAAGIGLLIGDLENLAQAFLHPIDAAKSFAADQAKGFQDLANTILHPIDSITAFGKAKADAFKDSPAGDIFGSITSGASAVGSIWGDLTKKLNEATATIKKPDLQLIDPTQIKAMESAISTLAALDDKLKQQVATYGLSGAAATAYDLTLGKLSASVAEVDKASPKQIQQALAQLEKQGKLSTAAIDDINTAIKAGVPPGEALKNVALGYADALDKLKAVDSLSKLDSQLLTMTGHLQEASQAAFDLANRPLKVTIQTAQDKTQFSGLDDSQKTAEVTSQLNALNTQAISIQDALGKKTADVAAAGLAAGESNLQIAGDEAVARQGAIAQLEALYVKAQALANATGLKSAVDQALALRTAIGAIQFDPKIVDDVNAATEAQKKYNEVLVDEKKATDDLALTMEDLAKQSAQGAITDLDYMAKQDDARQHEIDQLTTIQAQLLDIVKNNPGNAAALDQYKKLSVQIDGIQAQMDQLAKTVRTDLTDDLSNAFVGFATGTETAKKALQSFVTNFTKQMLDLGSKNLFQKLFQSTGANDEISSLFGHAAGAAPAIASTGAAAVGTDTGALASTIDPFKGIPALADQSSALNAPSSALNDTTSALNASTSALLSPSVVQTASGAIPDLTKVASTGAAAVGTDTGALASTINPFASTAAGTASTEAAATAISTSLTTAATAAGTAMGTAITTAATTGATGLGTAIETSGTTAATAMGSAIEAAGTAAAAAMAEAITAAGAGGGGGISSIASTGAAAAGTDTGSVADTIGLDLVAAAAGGGPIPANQLTLVGEKGPELYVSDLGEQTAATATQAGTIVPEDLTHAQVIGTGGPEYIRPSVSGFVVPSDTFLAALSDRAAPGTEDQSASQSSAVIPNAAQVSPVLGADAIAPQTSVSQPSQLPPDLAARESQLFGQPTLPSVPTDVSSIPGESSPSPSQSTVLAQHVEPAVPELPAQVPSSQRQDVSAPALPVAELPSIAARIRGSAPVPSAEPATQGSTTASETGLFRRPGTTAAENVEEHLSATGGEPRSASLSELPDVTGSPALPLGAVGESLNSDRRSLAPVVDLTSRIAARLPPAPDIAGSGVAAPANIGHAISPATTSGSTVIPSERFLAALADRAAPNVSSLPPAEPDVAAEPADSESRTAPRTQAAAGTLAPVVDLTPLIAAHLPAKESRLFSQPEASTVPKAPESPSIAQASLQSVVQAIPAPQTISAPRLPEVPASPQQPETPIAAAAEGGPVSSGQTIYVGEQGPELLVSDAGGVAAVSATLSGTQVPRDLGSSQFIGIGGPEYITPTTSGYVIPADVLAPQITAQQQLAATSASAPSVPSASSYSTSVNGIPTPIGLTETFTTVTQGGQTYTSINENVNAYVGMQLPAGTVTASGGTVVAAGDITYPPGGETPQQYLGIYNTPDQLAQQQANVTLASYFAQFGGAAGASVPATATIAPALLPPQPATLSAAQLAQPVSSSAQAQLVQPASVGAQQLLAPAQPEAPTGFGSLAPAATPQQVGRLAAAASPSAPDDKDLNAFVSSIPAFAVGGTFSGSSPILVGENGPEIIVPATSGTVIPAAATAGLSVPTTPTVPAALAAPATPAAPATSAAADKSLAEMTTGIAASVVLLGLIHLDLTRLGDASGASSGGLASLFGGGAGTSGIAQTGAAATGTDLDTLASSIPAFAAGGTFTGGSPIMVGEQGPELIVPDAPGTVIPNHAITHELATGNLTAASLSSSFPAPTALSLPDSAATPAAASVTAAPATPDITSITAAALNASSITAAPTSDVPSITAAQTPAPPHALDQPTSATILKFENVIKHEQSNLLSAHEYETLLTDRYLKKRAAGGPASAGTPYLVGENGPELMVPDSSGTVMNSWDDSQSNRSTVVHQYNNFLIQSQTGKVDRASQGQIAARTQLAVQMASGRNN